jgi:hypothetical protein
VAISLKITEMSHFNENHVSGWKAKWPGEYTICTTTKLPHPLPTVLSPALILHSLHLYTLYHIQFSCTEDRTQNSKHSTWHPSYHWCHRSIAASNLNTWNQYIALNTCSHELSQGVLKPESMHGRGWSSNLICMIYNVFSPKRYHQFKLPEVDNFFYWPRTRSLKQFK